MICVFCKGRVVEREVEEDITVGSDHLVVTVKAEVCENCHEHYYSEGVIDSLQRLKRELRAKKDSFKAVGQVYHAVNP